MITLNFQKGETRRSWEIFDLKTGKTTDGVKQYGGTAALSGVLELSFSTKEELPTPVFDAMGVNLWIDTPKKNYRISEIIN